MKTKILKIISNERMKYIFYAASIITLFITCFCFYHTGSIFFRNILLAIAALLMGSTFFQILLNAIFD